jgi:hypothetical protein
MCTEAGMHRALVEAGARVPVAAKQGNWGTGAVAVAVAAGIDAGLGAWWMRAGLGTCLQMSKLRANSLAAAAAAGIVGAQWEELERLEGRAGAGQGPGGRRVNHRQMSPVLGGDRM